MSKPVPTQKPAFPRRARSTCADAALQAEIKRLERMSIEERVKEALTIRDRFEWLAGPPRSK